VFAAEQIPLEEIDVFLKQALKSAHVIDLRRIHEASDLHKTLVGVARAGGFPLVEENVGSEAIIDLSGPWDAFRRAIPWNLEKTTARHLRQLRGLGDLTLEVVNTGERLVPMVQECLRLETLGWKSQFGTPILSRVDTARFYTELAAVGTADGFVTLYGLRLNGRLIAFEYCLRSGVYIEMLKISYAPDLAHYSPGNVLRYLLLRREIELGEVKSYHMGLTSEWKRRWAVRFEPLSRIRIYDRGIAARVGYYVGPRARDLLRRCTPLVMGVRWARRLKDKTARGR
jgi:CelD/BcsL family acetyltransferase involved in cellulose biosynthesis